MHPVVGSWGSAVHMSRIGYGEVLTDAPKGWVEFFGPPGAGKSSLYERFLSQGSISEPWVSWRCAREEIFRLRRLEEIGQGAGFRNAIKRLVLLYRWPRRLYNKIIRLSDINEIPRQGFWDQRAFYESVFRVALETSSELPKPPYLRMMGLHWLLRSLSEYLFLTSYPIGKIVVFDEFLIQRTYAIGASLAFGDQHRRYLEVLPAPRLAVYCHARSSTVFERVVKRAKSTGRLISAHRCGSVDELRRTVDRQCQIGEGIRAALVERGVNVLDLNLEEETDCNLSRLRAAVDDASGRWRRR